MLNKKFVSLVFSSKRLQIVLMDGKKKKVVKHSTVVLPAGMIVNFKVRSTIELGKIIQDEFKKLKISEKSVGIVIPEFSTYIKTVTLPKVEKQDLNEAIRWQAQDFLPAAEREMIMDWRIIREEKDKTQVLVAAVRKDVLQGYVDAVSGAGFYPMVIETPSLSLSRISGESGKAKLIIYVYFDEAVIVLAQERSIIATSVANSNSQREIINSAERISKHYATIEVEKVMLGGASLASDFKKNIEQFIKLPVEEIKGKYSGLNEQEMQDYLIPVSMQLKNPAIPENEYTINLLPPEWEKVYKDRVFNLQLWLLTLITSGFIWAMFLFSVSVYILLSTRLHSINSELAKTGDEESQAVYDEVTAINKLSSKIIEINESAKDPIKYINTIANSKPEGININLYHIDIEAGVVGISGVSSNRNTLVDWKVSLEQNEEIEAVLLPPSSYIEEENINFEMGINLSIAKKSSVPKLKL